MKAARTPNYKFVTVDMGDGRIKTIAIARYAKKPVRGVAICSPSDTYNEEFGKALARARCDARIAEKRFKNAQKQSMDIQKERIAVSRKSSKVESYYNDSYNAYMDTKRNVKLLLLMSNAGE